MEQKAYLRAVIRGRVQGVNFRRFVADKATLFGLQGTVRNLPDGTSLEVHAEGARVGLLSLLEHLHHGPRGAMVERVETEWAQFKGTYRGFTIADY